MNIDRNLRARAGRGSREPARAIDRRAFIAGACASLGSLALAADACERGRNTLHGAGAAKTPASGGRGSRAASLAASASAAPPVASTAASSPKVAAKAPSWLYEIGASAPKPLAIATLRLTSGRLVGCDPLVFLDEAPFTEVVEPGRYPVSIGMKHGEVAYTMMTFSDAHPTSWDVAIRTNDDPRSSLGYLVDSGTGCFVDQEVARAVAKGDNEIIDAALRAVRGKEEGDSVEDYLRWSRAVDIEEARLRRSRPDMLSKIQASGIYSKKWANVLIDVAAGTSLVAFRSGAGDGMYVSYWGRDAAGKIVSIVTDFNLLGE
jgi:Protein of unknown function (DUF4241)